MSKTVKQSLTVCLLGNLLAGLLVAGCQASQPPEEAPAPTLIASATRAPPATSTPVPTKTTARAAPIAIESVQDLRSIVREIAMADRAEAQSKADALWQTLTGDNRVPLVLNEQAVFLYKGEAQSVIVRGDFNGWDQGPGLEAQRIGQTDLWMAQTALPIDSRVEYKIVLDGDTWILDPANASVVQRSLGDNSVLAMPEFKVTDETTRRSDVQPGTMTDDLEFESNSLGYAVNYRVYAPAGYETLDELPVLYVTDGNDFADERMGKMHIVLDNLIADDRIEPVMAVFLDAREPGNPENNRRELEFLAHPEEFARFIAKELVPNIDAAYRTDPSPEARVIQGVSYGGVGATFIAASHPDVFHNLAVFSPAYDVLDSADSFGDADKAAGVRKIYETLLRIVTCGADTGVSCPPLPLNFFMSTGYYYWDVGDQIPLVAELRRKQYPVEFVQVQESHTWGNWSGLLDEMLIYFFGR